VLWPGDATSLAFRIASFRASLREGGFVEGRNIAYELRHADGRMGRLPRLAGELVGLGPDVITPAGAEAIRAVQHVTKTIPIVGTSDDFVGEKIVTSLARPGGNTTGVSLLSPEFNVKRLELLRQLLPGIKRVALLWDPATGQAQLTSLTTAAKSLAIELQVLAVSSPDDVAIAFQHATERNAQALNVLASPMLSSQGERIVALAAQNRLPAIYQWSALVKAGGLISYGSNLQGLWRQAGVLVAKVLGGAKPAELPVEQPRATELFVNLKTAQTLGITIPPTLVARADEVIE
jgi:putative ABC transport system substrate-binding protein